MGQGAENFLSLLFVKLDLSSQCLNEEFIDYCTTELPPEIVATKERAKSKMSLENFIINSSVDYLKQF